MSRIKTKGVKAKLGDPDMFRSVDGIKQLIASKVTDRLRSYIDDVDRKHQADFAPLNAKRLDLITEHRIERSRLTKAQANRRHSETKARAAKLNTGLRGLWDTMRGKTAKIKEQNELDAWQCAKRDQSKRDVLIKAQMVDRRELQSEIDKLRQKHVQNCKLLAKEISQTMAFDECDRDADSHHHDQSRDRPQDHGLER